MGKRGFSTAEARSSNRKMADHKSGDISMNGIHGIEEEVNEEENNDIRGENTSDEEENEEEDENEDEDDDEEDDEDEDEEGEEGGDEHKEEGDDDDNDDEEEEEEDVDDDGDIDKAISKADAKKKSKDKSYKYLNNILKISNGTELQMAMRKTFQEVQTTVAVHKRHLTILKTIMERAHALELSEVFNNFFCFLLNKILPIKKSVKAADKVVKFVSSFFELMNPTNSSSASENPEVYTLSMGEREELYTGFVERVLKYLVKGLDAMNTTVRYRVCHLLSYIIGNCGGMDEDLYESISDELSTRIYDRDSSVRIKAVAALSCFQNDDGGALSLSGKKLRFIMQNDLNSEVRRACMKNLEKNKFTEPFIVERARDIDATNRRILFSRVLPSYSHFTDISSANRNKLLEWGLRDRDENVRKAAGNWLTTTWMDDTKNDIIEFLDRLNVIESDIADIAVRTLLDKNPGIVNNLKIDSEFFESLTPPLSLLLRVVFQYCQDNNETSILEDTFLEAAEFATLIDHYFTLRNENFKKISDNREALEQNAELAISLDIIDPDEYNYIIMQLLKIAVDYDYSDGFGRNKMYSVLRSTLSGNTVTEPILPLLMECLRKLAINERDFCQMTIEIINDLKDSEYERVMDLKKEEEVAKQKEILAAANARKRQRRSRNNSEIDDSEIETTEDLNTKVANLLRKDEGDIDSDSDISDSDEYHSAMNDMSRQSIIEANKSRQEEIDQVSILSPEILTDCLTIAKCMLQLVFAPLRENMLLISLLDNFIVPCVNERSEVEVRELALTCHGLCGLLDKEVAVSTMVVAGIFVTRSDYESFVVTGLKVIGDLLTIHGISILQSDQQISIDTMAVAKVFYRTLKDESKPEAQSVVAVTLFKLFLCGVITDDELFETTLLTYFNPKVNKNKPLKQCLKFCIPTYAFSHKSHQELIASIVYDTVDRLYRNWEEITRLNQELEVKQPVTANFIIESLLYWTDPYNLVMVEDEDAACSSIHLDVGIQFMALLRNYDYHNKIHKMQYKPILRALSKLTFTYKSDIEKLRKFRACFDDDKLCQGDIDEVLNSDLICKNSFLKCHTYIQECLKEAEELEQGKLERENTNQSNTEAEHECHREGLDGEITGKGEVSTSTAEGHFDEEPANEGAKADQLEEADEAVTGKEAAQLEEVEDAATGEEAAQMATHREEDSGTQTDSTHSMEGGRPSSTERGTSEEVYVKREKAKGERTKKESVKTRGPKGSKTKKARAKSKKGDKSQGSLNSTDVRVHDETVQGFKDSRVRKPKHRQHRERKAKRSREDGRHTSRNGNTEIVLLDSSDSSIPEKTD